MDQQQLERIQLLGFFGIFKESFKIFFSRKKIFSQITLATIIPLALILFANLFLSEYLIAKVLRNGWELDLDDYQTTNPKYAYFSDISPLQWTGLGLLQVAFLIIFFIFNLLATSAVVYTVAFTYTAKEITFKKVLSHVPSIWKKFLVTCVWSFIISLVYNVVGITILILVIALLITRIPALGIPIFVILLILFLVGAIYIVIITQMASVVTLLEDAYGRKALKKSKSLVKGKKGVGFGICLILALCSGGIQFVYQWLVVLYLPDWATVERRIGFAVLCFVLMCLLTLMGLILQTVFYFVCKSNHQEDIVLQSDKQLPV